MRTRRPDWAKDQGKKSISKSPKARAKKGAASPKSRATSSVGSQRKGSSFVSAASPKSGGLSRSQSARSKSATPRSMHSMHVNPDSAAGSPLSGFRIKDDDFRIRGSSPNSGSPTKRASVASLGSVFSPTSPMTPGGSIMSPESRKRKLFGKRTSRKPGDPIPRSTPTPTSTPTFKRLKSGDMGDDDKSPEPRTSVQSLSKLIFSEPSVPTSQNTFVTAESSTRIPVLSSIEERRRQWLKSQDVDKRTRTHAERAASSVVLREMRRSDRVREAVQRRNQNYTAAFAYDSQSDDPDSSVAPSSSKGKVGPPPGPYGGLFSPRSFTSPRTRTKPAPAFVHKLKAEIRARAGEDIESRYSSLTRSQRRALSEGDVTPESSVPDTPHSTPVRGLRKPKFTANGSPISTPRSSSPSPSPPPTKRHTIGRPTSPAGARPKGRPKSPKAGSPGKTSVRRHSFSQGDTQHKPYVNQGLWKGRGIPKGWKRPEGWKKPGPKAKKHKGGNDSKSKTSKKNRVIATGDTSPEPAPSDDGTVTIGYVGYSTLDEDSDSGISNGLRAFYFPTILSDDF